MGRTTIMYTHALKPPSDTVAQCVRAAQDVLQKYMKKRLVAPVDIEQLAADLGFQIIQLHSPADEFSGLVSPRHKLIGVNANHHLHRQRFTIAHELSHFILRHEPEGECTSREVAAQDAEADACASELLMPSQLLEPYLTGGVRVTVRSLAKLFNVSEEAMSHKVQDAQKQKMWSEKLG